MSMQKLSLAIIASAAISERDGKRRSHKLDREYAVQLPVRNGARA